MTGISRLAFMISTVTHSLIRGVLTVEEIISKIEHEIEFQKKQSREYKSGIYKNEILFARYDQSVKILEWVLELLKKG